MTTCELTGLEIPIVVSRETDTIIGKLDDQYRCYLAYTADLYPKTFQEWLDS